MKELNYEEKELLRAVLLNAIGNGNTANPKPFNPTPKQHKQLYSITNKLGFNRD